MAREVIRSQVKTNKTGELKQSRRNLAGEEVLLEVEVAERGASGEVGREGTGESVETETESVEVREVGEYAGGELAGECDGGEVKFDDVGVVLVTLDAEPFAGSRGSCVPEKGSAGDGGA